MMKTITLTPDASGMVDWPTLSNDKKSVVTIGSFDGMHQGHQAVIRRVVELAKKEQSFSVVVLFDPRPALVHGYAAQNGGQEPPAGMIDASATGPSRRGAGRRSTPACAFWTRTPGSVCAPSTSWAWITRSSCVTRWRSRRNRTDSSSDKWWASWACAR